MTSKTNPLPHLDTDYWIRHFERNQENRPEPPWDAPIKVSSHAFPSLLQSLREFELGDGGGPAGLIAFNAQSFRCSTEDIRKIVDLWFDEEKEHSRLLGETVKRFGGKRLNSHWSFTLFCLLRKVLGVAFELQILTLTELVSTSYYTLLRRHCPDPVVKAVCKLILRDESGHVRFQNDRLAAMGRSRFGLRNRLWRWQFWICGYGAATVLWLSHNPAIRKQGGSTLEFYTNVEKQIGTFLHQLDCKALCRGKPRIGLVSRLTHFIDRYRPSVFAHRHFPSIFKTNY